MKQSAARFLTSVLALLCLFASMGIAARIPPADASTTLSGTYDSGPGNLDFDPNGGGPVLLSGTDGDPDLWFRIKRSIAGYADIHYSVYCLDTWDRVVGALSGGVKSTDEAYMHEVLATSCSGEDQVFSQIRMWDPHKGETESTGTIYVFQRHHPNPAENDRHPGVYDTGPGNLDFDRYGGGPIITLGTDGDPDLWFRIRRNIDATADINWMVYCADGSGAMAGASSGGTLSTATWFTPEVSVAGCNNQGLSFAEVRLWDSYQGETEKTGTTYRFRLSDSELEVRADGVERIALLLAPTRICEEVLVTPGTHVQGTSTSDQYNECESARLAGGSSAQVMGAVAQASRHNAAVLQGLFDAIMLVAVTEVGFDRSPDPDDPSGLPLVLIPYADDDPTQSPDVEPEPDPSAAGAAGMKPPFDPGCLDAAGKQALADSMNDENHHIATHYDGPGLWATQYRDILEQWGLGHMTLEGDWNIIRMPHAGPHPDRYKEWIADNMRRAGARAYQEVDRLMPAASEPVKAEQREVLFREAWKYVRDILANDPAIVRKDWWVC